MFTKYNMLILLVCYPFFFQIKRTEIELDQFPKYLSRYSSMCNVEYKMNDFHSLFVLNGSI